MNRDMKEKGIVLRKLSNRTAAELPSPEQPDCRQRRSSWTAAEALASVRPPSKPSGSGSSGGVLRELNCHRCFPGAPAGVLRELKSLPVVAWRQSGSSAPGVQSLSPPCLLAAPAERARRQSGRERDCTPGAELPPSSPCRSCLSTGPQNLSNALIGGEWGSGR